MINSLSDPPLSPEEEARVLTQIQRTAPVGALLLAGLGTATVVAIWLAFYTLVFLARVTPP